MLTKADMAIIAKGMATAIKVHTARLEQRIADLEARLSEQKNHVMKYQGIHHRMASYQRGDVVTNGGGLWICTRDGTRDSKPGTDAGWMLIAKGDK